MTDLANIVNAPIPGSPRFQQDTAMAIARLRASLGPTGTPSFSTLALPGLTDNRPIYADADGILTSVTVGSSLAFSAPTLNTIQGIRTTDSPTFAGLTLTAMSGVVKATAGVLAGGGAHGDLVGVSANQHHNQSHVLNGGDHTVSGLTVGHVLQALTPTTFGFATVPGLHDAVSLAASADTLLGLTGQALSLDTQTATYVLAGPTTGLPAAAPTFRALIATDIPALAYDATGTAVSLLSGHTSTYDHTLLHTRQHSITSTSDHTSSATATYLLKADANGLPTTATNTDAAVAAAVTASHAAVTVVAAPLTLSGQAITFNYDTNDFQLSGNNLQVKDGGIAHDSTSGVHQDVNTTASPTFVKVVGSNGATGGLYVKDSSGVAQPRITGDNSDTTILRTGKSGGNIDINNFANSAQLISISDTGGMMFSATGYVGFLNNAVNSGIRFNDTGGTLRGTMYVDADNSFAFRGVSNTTGASGGVKINNDTNAATILWVQSNGSTYLNINTGNTGIGLSAGATINEKLEVAGKIRANTAFNLNGTDGVSSTLTLDDGANWRITMTFSGGILTAKTTAASSGATATWS